MKNMKLNLFGKKDDDGRKRYWISVRSCFDKEAQLYHTATINTNLSKKAEEKFGEFAHNTKNDRIKMMRVEMTDWWFKAVRFGDNPAVIIFINDFNASIDAEAPKW